MFHIIIERISFVFENRTIDYLYSVNVKKKEETTLTKGEVDDRIEKSWERQSHFKIS